MAQPMPQAGDSGHHLARPPASPAGASADWRAARARLAEFRDAGLLTEAELEEQMERLRWGPMPCNAARLGG